MPVINLSCPKCRKEVTEYEEGKWKCLHCGNRMIYEKPITPTYNVNVYAESTINYEPIVEETIKDIELDTKMEEQKRIEFEKEGVNDNVAYACIGVSIVITVILCFLVYPRFF